MKLLAYLLVASAAFAQNRQPNVTNSQFESRAFSGDLASDIRSVSAAWFGYAVKTTPGNHDGCCSEDSHQCGCHLEGSGSNTTAVSRSKVPVQLEGSDAVAILFRVANNTVEKVRVYSLCCPLEAGGLPFVWLTGVPATASLSYLRKLVLANVSDHVADGAIFAIAQHEGRPADNILDQLTRPTKPERIREKAIFWLAQKAGERAVSTITDVIQNDPDTRVKKQAVFALSQLPKDEGVPKLIEVARTQKNPEVRKQAFFWLGQSKDPRALAFFEEILTR
jgi:hypothetical protein